MTCPDGKYCYGTTDAGTPFYCNYKTGKCDPFDPCNGSSGTWSCNGTSGGTGSSGSTVAVDPAGISFVVVGDTRPDSSGMSYPTGTIDQIYTDFTQLKPMAVVASGDFVEQGDSDISSEFSDYEQAVQILAGTSYANVPVYPTLGNHECDSTNILASCSPNPAPGMSPYSSPEFSAFMQMLADMNVPNTNGQPYYVNTLTAPNGDTAKFVITAANAWDQTQVAWLNATLATSTTFTLIARHEPDDAMGCNDATANDNTTSDCPFVADVQAAINSHPGGVILKLEGHTHELRFDDQNDGLVSGGGGVSIQSSCSSDSPNTTYCNYGFFYCQERTDKSLLCTAYDGLTGAALSTPAPRVVTSAGMSYAN